MLLFDCEEYYMQNRLIKRGKESGRIDDNISAIAKKLHYYKHNTLPVLKYYDDCDKLVVVRTHLPLLPNVFEPQIVLLRILSVFFPFLSYTVSLSLYTCTNFYTENQILIMP